MLGQFPNTYHSTFCANPVALKYISSMCNITPSFFPPHFVWWTYRVSPLLPIFWFQDEEDSANQHQIPNQRRRNLIFHIAVRASSGVQHPFLVVAASQGNCCMQGCTSVQGRDCYELSPRTHRQVESDISVSPLHIASPVLISIICNWVSSILAFSIWFYLHFTLSIHFICILFCHFVHWFCLILVWVASKFLHFDCMQPTLAKITNYLYKILTTYFG